MKNEYKVNFVWDDEALVWIASSDDILGLILEHDSFDILVDRVCQTIPELLVSSLVINDDIFLNISASGYRKVNING